MKANEVRSLPRCVLISLDGWLSPHASEWLLGEAEAFLRSGARFFVFDCDRLRALNTSAIGFLAETRRRLKRVNGLLSLVRLTSDANEKLLLTGLTVAFSVYKTGTEALQALETHPRAWAAEVDRSLQ